MRAPTFGFVYLLFVKSDGRTEGSNLTAKGLSETELRRSAWSEFLSGVFEDQLTELVTLTFATAPWQQALTEKGPTESRVVRAAQSFERDLQRDPSCSYFGVLESGAWSGRRHIHVLVTQPDREVFLLRESLARSRMKNGLVDVRPVNSIGGVSAYVTKYVTKSYDPRWFAGGPLWQQSRGR